MENCFSFNTFVLYFWEKHILKLKKYKRDKRLQWEERMNIGKQLK